jgi:hypothetical protein
MANEPVTLTENESRILGEIAQANNEVQRQANDQLNYLRGRLRDVYTLIDDRHGTDLVNGTHIINNDGQVVLRPAEQENEVAA